MEIYLRHMKCVICRSEISPENLINICNQCQKIIVNVEQKVDEL